MKKLILFLAIFVGVSVVAKADNVTPSSAAKVEISHNAFNYMQVKLSNVDTKGAVVKIYSSDFELLSSTRLGEDGSRMFNIAQLMPGNYIVKVEKDGTDIHTEVVHKVK